MTEDSYAAAVLWIVGQPFVPGQDPPAWACAGVFQDKERAIELAIQRGGFVGPIVLDKVLPVTMKRWPGMWYPGDEPEPAPGEYVRRDAGRYKV